MIKPYECTQCGATNFEELSGRRVRCTFCGSLFRVMTQEPSVVIGKGAKVVFGKGANVEIRGDLDVETGADVEVQGKVTVLKDGKQQEFKLELIRKGEKKSSGR